MGKRKGTLIVMVGVPGSGKSTYSKQLMKESSNIVIHSSDAIRGEIFGDESIQFSEEVALKRMQNKGVDYSSMTPEELEKAMRSACNSMVFGKLMGRTKRDLLNGVNVIYDATNINSKGRKRLLKDLKDYYDNAICYYFPISKEVAIERDSKRERTVGADVIERMMKSLQEPTEDEGFSFITTVM